MAKQNVWLSVSDLMTGLMVIFLFVAIAYIKKVQDNQNVLTDYVETKQKLHEKLVKEFEGDTARWQMTVGKDLSMKFNNPQVLFAQGSADITPGFRAILDEFIPKYLDILLKEDSASHNIQEVRIEGHTDNVPYPKLHSDPFIANIILSQSRARAVLEYVLNMPYIQSISENRRRTLEYWLTANGLSYGRSLDHNGILTYESHAEIDLDKSRRVEFRIVTTGDEVLERFVKENSK